MKSEFVFRGHKASDDKDLARLMKETFGVELRPEFFEWKYRRNPRGEPLSAVAEKDGKVIGQMGSIPINLCIDGKEQIASQEVDGCLDKKAGKFDTFFQLNDLRRRTNAEKQIPFSYFFSVEMSSKLSARMGLHIVCSEPVLARVLNVDPFVRKRLPAVSPVSPLLAPLANRMLRLLYARGSFKPAGTRLKQVERFDARFDDFWQRVRGDYPIMTVRDQAYLNWRYQDVPFRDCRVLSLEKRKTLEILGFIVYAERHRDVKVGQILDIVTPKGSPPGIARFLLKQAVRDFYRRGLDLAVCWMFPHCHIYAELTRLGFRSREQKGLDLIYRHTNPKDPVVPDELAGNPENWYLCMGDSDIY